MNPAQAVDHQPRPLDQASLARPVSTPQPMPATPVSNPVPSVIQTMSTATTPSSSIMGRPSKGVTGFTTTAPLDRSKGQALTPSSVPAAANAAQQQVQGYQDGENSARIVSALVPGGSTGSNMGHGVGEVNKSPYSNVNVNAGNGLAGGTTGAGKWAWDSGYSTPSGETEAGKRKREGNTQTPGSQAVAGTPVSGVGAGAGAGAGQAAGRNFDYSSDEMDDDMEDDEEDEDIEREPLPGENIFSRIRRGEDGSDVEEDAEEDGTAIIHVRRAAAEEVDELESANGTEQEQKVGQVKKIKLVLNNNGKGKGGKMVIGPDGKPRKRLVFASGRVDVAVSGLCG